MGKAFERISRGLQEAIGHAEGKASGVVVHKPKLVNVAQVRQSLGLTQTEFASKFGISLGTLRHWERGDRTPNWPALALLNVVAKEPKAVLRALA